MFAHYALEPTQTVQTVKVTLQDASCAQLQTTCGTRLTTTSTHNVLTVKAMMLRQSEARTEVEFVQDAQSSSPTAVNVANPAREPTFAQNVQQVSTFSSLVTQAKMPNPVYQVAQECIS